MESNAPVSSTQFPLPRLSFAPLELRPGPLTAVSNVSARNHAYAHIAHAHHLVRARSLPSTWHDPSSVPSLASRVGNIIHWSHSTQGVHSAEGFYAVLPSHPSPYPGVSVHRGRSVVAANSGDAALLARHEAAWPADPPFPRVGWVDSTARLPAAAWISTTGHGGLLPRAQRAAIKEEAHARNVNLLRLRGISAQPGSVRPLSASTRPRPTGT